MSQLKSLAGQTAVYGVSSILGRLINYALVPLHTSVFLPSAMGVVTALYAYTAIFMIIYTFGMETAYFRFAKADPIKAYNSCATVILSISTIFSIIIICFSDFLAASIGYPETGNYLIFIAIIMWIDSLVSLPFAKLRFENKARKFAAIKIVNIGLNILIQASLLLFAPLLIELFSNNDFHFEITIKYIFLANLIANAAIILFMFKDITSIKLVFNYTQLKPYLMYGVPIFIMGLGGMLNEQLDKIVLEHLLPEGFYSNLDSTSALGVYGQTFKLAIFMMLAIQAFRYAGEPFFFSKADDKQAPELFAKVMHYFVISALLLLLLVSINVDFIAYIFLRKPEYRVALYLVPILLFGKLLYGVYLNLSIWFKITDKTFFGTYFSIVGLIITITGNILLIPVLGMLGSALTVILCYLIMSFVCLYYGQKHFPIPYNFMKLVPYLVITLVLVYISFNVQYPDQIIDAIIRIIFSILITTLLWINEKRKLVTNNS